jgi:hypothetical protein
MATWPRDFKFAGSVGQRPYLVMLKIGCQGIMLGFFMESHIIQYSMGLAFAINNNWLD